MHSVAGSIFFSLVNHLLNLPPTLLVKFTGNWFSTLLLALDKVNKETNVYHSLLGSEDQNILAECGKASFFIFEEHFFCFQIQNQNNG